MEINEQSSTPLFDAVKRYVSDHVIQFHVPGHKQGQGIPEFLDYVGEHVLQMDANGMKDLDYFNNPTGVIKESQKLLAEAYGAEDAYFLVNGTTSGIQTMILSICNPGSEIIIPRNAHKSVINSIILSGAIPIFIYPEINKTLGIAMGITVEEVKKTITEHPNAKSILVINPTYYGFASDIKAITEIAHEHDMTVIVDEAHGAHFAFHADFPLTAMKAGADACAISIHKTAGALTQSSALLISGNRISRERVKSVLNMLFTSSASYLLLSSLDVARKQLALKGTEMYEKALKLSRWARDEINKIHGAYAFGKEWVGEPGCFAFDETKLSINVRELGLTGYEMETLLRDKYNIQVEFGDIYNILCIISLGHHEEDLAALINALDDVSKNKDMTCLKNSTLIPNCPEMIVPPRTAFYNEKKVVELENAEGEIAGEMVISYPPGIPVLCLGERITREIINYVMLLKEEHCELQGTADPDVNYIRVLSHHNPHISADV